MTSSARFACPVCAGTAVLDVLFIPQVPVYCNVLWEDRKSAVSAASGDLALGFCTDCGHLFNAAFDPRLTEYTSAYDNSLHYSSRFNRYAEDLAAQLIRRHTLRGKRVVEIGCGKGDFLRLLCADGSNRGFGFDRSFEPERLGTSGEEHVTFYQAFYDAEAALGCAPDFVCCRHVLEHVDRPTAFLLMLRETIGQREDVSVYCEVPNVLFTLKDNGIWDLIYEHCGYFSLSSLIRAFTDSGFDVTAADESFGGQFIWVEAKPAKRQGRSAALASQSATEIRSYADSFADKYRATVDSWRWKLAEADRQGRRIVIWGAGSKGVSFLNVAASGAAVAYVVDVNPHKQGRFVAGTGQQVIAPGALRDIGASEVIVMNPMYLDEVASAVRSMGLEIPVLCVQ